MSNKLDCLMCSAALPAGEAALVATASVFVFLGLMAVIALPFWLKRKFNVSRLLTVPALFAFAVWLITAAVIADLGAVQ